MLTNSSIQELYCLAAFLEWFLYGIYSGIFAVYLQVASKDFRTRTNTIIFYSLCLLYILSTANVVSDLLQDLIDSDAQPQFNLQYRVMIVQDIANDLCDFIAQCTLIYRCWIVWGKNIWVVIAPSFLAITYIATSLASEGTIIINAGGDFAAPWGGILIITSYVTSMVVNALVTCLIVFKILKVVKATSGERKLGSLISTGGPKLQHVIFMIIESGMALFSVQLARVVINSLNQFLAGPTPINLIIISNFVIVLNQAFNGIIPTIILVRVAMKLSYDSDSEESVGSLNFKPPSNPDSLQSSSSMPPEERNEDPNIILEVRREAVESSSGQEKSLAQLQ